MFGTCLEAGVNFFDNAEGYERGQSEIVMGKALKALTNLERLVLRFFKGILWSERKIHYQLKSALAESI